MKKKSNIWVYVIFIGVTLAVGGLSALITSGSMDIYGDIILPPLAPPSILFPIVWTILYVLMGISAAMIYTDRFSSQKSKTDALTVYALQLIFNFFWSIFFFNLRAFLFSFLWLAVLLLLIVKMIVDFVKIKKLAGYLQIPYLIWVTFAGYLNLGIYLLNR